MIPHTTCLTHIWIRTSTGRYRKAIQSETTWLLTCENWCDCFCIQTREAYLTSITTFLWHAQPLWELHYGEWLHSGGKNQRTFALKAPLTATTYPTYGDPFRRIIRSTPIVQLLTWTPWDRTRHLSTISQHVEKKIDFPYRTRAPARTCVTHNFIVYKLERAVSYFYFPFWHTPCFVWSCDWPRIGWGILYLMWQSHDTTHYLLNSLLDPYFKVG